MGLILYGIVLILVAIVILIMNQLDKDKMAEVALKTMSEK